MYCIVFDFDGPILDSRTLASKALKAAWRETFANSSDIDIDGIPLFNTSTIVRMALAKYRIHLDEEDEGRLIDKYSELLDTLERNAVLDPDILEALNYLSDNPLAHVAIISNRLTSNLDRLLRYLGIRHLFGSIYGRDIFAPKPDSNALEELIAKTKVDKNSVLMIGDQDIDYLLAQNVGVSYCHTSYTMEPCNRSLLEANFVFESPRVLKHYVMNITQSEAHNSFDYRVKSFSSNDYRFYVGSGISVPSGIGDWELAYRKAFDEVGISHLFDSKTLVSTLQMLAFDERYSKKLYDRFREYFAPSSRFQPNAYHYILLNNRPKRIYTTNYDCLFEQVITQEHMNYDIIKNDRDFVNSRNQRSLIKVNGDFEDASYSDNLNWQLMFFQEQFTLFKYDRPCIYQSFINDFVSSTIIFIGISFSDPGLTELISVIKHKGLQAEHKHFYLTTASHDFKESYLQHLKERELSRYGIVTLYFNNFEDIISYLEDLYFVSNEIHIGISGSIPYDIDLTECYSNSLFSVKETNDICYRLGQLLAQSGYSISSGGAPNIGIPFAEGAYDVSTSHSKIFYRRFGTFHYKRSVPVEIVNSENLSDMRNVFIPRLDFLIVMAGRQNVSDGGIIEEINIAMQSEIPIIVLTQFGGLASTYYETFIKNIPLLYPNYMANSVLNMNTKINSLNKNELILYLFNEFSNELKSLLIERISSTILHQNVEH